MSRWTLRLYGEVDAPATLHWSEVQALPRTTITADMHCVTTWSRLDNNWEGVAFKDLVGLVKPRGSAGYVIAHCASNYTTRVPVEVLADDDVLIADRHDGAELTADHGGPLRLSGRDEHRREIQVGHGEIRPLGDDRLQECRGFGVMAFAQCEKLHDLTAIILIRSLFGIEPAVEPNHHRRIFVDGDEKIVKPS